MVAAAPDYCRNCRSSKQKLKDGDLRNAVLTKVIADHVSDPNCRVVEELGLQHGASRVDIAVINGTLHGYELKSEADNLNRLPGQIAAYSKVFDRVTLVAAHNHMHDALKRIPTWWGAKVASKNTRGGITIETVRKVGNNHDISPFHVAQLLWRDEALILIEALGINKTSQRMNRAALYQLLADSISVTELRSHVRQALKVRANWRGRSPL